MKLHLALLAAAAALTSAPPAQAWGPKGHQVVVYVARHYVEAYDQAYKTQVAARMDSLLAGATKPPSDTGDFANKGNWGDAIKYSSKAQKIRTENWHFIDIDVNADLSAADVVEVYCKAQPLPAGLKASDGHREDCVVSKIEQFRAELANRTLPAAERELALLHLMHLVGDIHQPLHAAERNHDFGGNGTKIVFPGQSWGDSLHGFWDGHVGRCDNTAPTSDKACVSLDGDYKVVGDYLVAQIDKADVSTWATGANASPAAWALASSALARSDGYGGLNAERTCKLSQNKSRKNPKGLPLTTTCAETDADYYLTASKVSDQQLMYAGVRLAAEIIDGLKAD